MRLADLAADGRIYRIKQASTPDHSFGEMLLGHKSTNKDVRK